MNLANAKSNRLASGVLFGPKTAKANVAFVRAEELAPMIARNKHKIAFAGLYLFTVMMYVRPQEVMPGLFGAMPVVKVIAIATLIAYAISKLAAGEPLTIKPVELKMIVLIWMLGLLFAPLAAAPGDSFQILFDPLIKTLLIFIVQINLLNTRARYRRLLGILVVCEILYALGSIQTYLAGGYADTNSFHKRITGWGTLFGNPNDIACVLALLLPFTVIYAMRWRGWKRWLLFAAVGLTAIAILLTFSRSGFLALLACCGVIFWKLNRGHRLKMLLPLAALVVLLLVAMPGRYMTRLSTIFNPQEDSTNSAQARQEQAKRAFQVAIRRPVVGVGMGNYHIYGNNELRAHNAYLEIAAELGVAGLLAFLTIIVVPMRALRRLEREAATDGTKPDPEIFISSICQQASFAAFLIYCLFGSVQYDSYLYTLTAYAVALRNIRATELAEATGNGLASNRPTRGVLWTPQRVSPRLLLGDGKKLST
jgi:probable O-glycosylation ligase (exosortase A-associated)